MKPCGHTQLVLPPAGEPYSTAYCRFCWLYQYRPDYRALWDSLPGGEPQQGIPRARPCCHRGTPLREEICPSCRGRVRVKVFVCVLHQECTLARAIPGCACCSSCPDYAPLPEGNPG